MSEFGVEKEIKGERRNFKIRIKSGWKINGRGKHGCRSHECKAC